MIDWLNLLYMPFPIDLSRLLSGLFPCEIAMRRSFCRSTRYPRAYGSTLYIKMDFVFVTNPPRFTISNNSCIVHV